MNEHTTMTMDDNNFLDAHIEAARAIDEDAVDAAARQFRAALPAIEPRRMRLPTWLRAAAVAAGLVLTVSLAPLLLPGQPGATAFAQAQAWFSSYRSMHFLMTTTYGGRTLSTVEVWTDDEGATRVDVAPVSHIVIPADNIMHTVMPGGQVMTRSLGLGADAVDLSETMGWLDEILEFQGLAETVDSPRQIDGISALGWRLSLPGGVHTLWVDPADNRPLLLEAELDGGVFMESSFRFNMPLPEGLFDVPVQP